MTSFYAEKCSHLVSAYAQNPLHTFPRNFPEDQEAANKTSNMEIIQPCQT